MIGSRKQFDKSSCLYPTKKGNRKIYYQICQVRQGIQERGTIKGNYVRSIMVQKMNRGTEMRRGKENEERLIEFDHCPLIFVTGGMKPEQKDCQEILSNQWLVRLVLCPPMSSKSD